MKIQTNIRAGAGQKRNSSTTEVPVEAVHVPVVPVSRCAGI
jgi:hypothetical protein